MSTESTEYRLIMQWIAVVCVLGLAGAIWPVVDAILSTIVTGALVVLGAAAALYLAHEALLEIEWRRLCRPGRDSTPPEPVERKEVP